MLRIFLFLLILLLPLVSPNYVYAEIELKEHIPDPIYANSGQVKFIFTSDPKDFTEEKYTFGAWRPNDRSEYVHGETAIHENIRPSPDKTTLEAIITIREGGIDQNLKTKGPWTYRLWAGDRFNLSKSKTYIVKQGAFDVFPPGGPRGSGLPAIRVETTIWQADRPQNVYIVNAQVGQDYTIWFNNDPKFLFSGRFNASQIVSKNTYEDENSATAVITNVGPASDSLKTLCMAQSDAKVGTLTLSCDFSITGINVVGVLPKALPPSKISNQVGIPSTSAAPIIPSVCPNDTCDTALGPIKTKPAQFIQAIFGILLSLAGGVALLLIILSGYKLMNSQGNPEKVQEAREQLTSAIVGLLFVIFSLTILQIIGVDILRIPGFS